MKIKIDYIDSYSFTGHTEENICVNGYFNISWDASEDSPIVEITNVAIYTSKEYGYGMEGWTIEGIYEEIKKEDYNHDELIEQLQDPMSHDWFATWKRDHEDSQADYLYETDRDSRLERS